MKYPRVMTEDETLDAALAGRSLARYGDGELRLATGGGCTSQRKDPALAEELRVILAEPRGNLLPCIPRVDDDCPRRAQWLEGYGKPDVLSLYRLPRYGSAFITRPDNAPVIDRPDYWDRARQLWRGRDVLLVAGDEKSLRSEAMLADGARRVTRVEGPRQHAYAEIDRIEEECLGHDWEVALLCLGAAATALAGRLAARDLWAVDAGHIGMFMRHAGAYAFSARQYELATKKYRLVAGRHRWAGNGWTRAGDVAALLAEVGGRTVLDYGCGSGSLRRALEPPFRVFEYDPCVPGKDDPPKISDVAVALNVLEHVEPECLDLVLRHLLSVTSTGHAYVSVSSVQSKSLLPDGRPEVFTARNQRWWTEKMGVAGGEVRRAEMRGDTVHLWITRKK